ncbi:unnamed protein product [Lepeophtheirus salmonis]|uniref:(salmon louse) hypothetical protein n=1 Tax=Lepeophtheirus salmonis TaxID=72036 RepID=A0A817FFJ8_LEPSM|nr:unnamed protein product [Lepeophtheirus salmonis]
MKERRSGTVEYLKQLGVSEVNATAYSKGPTTMQCIQLTEEGYKITGIQPNGSPYNASITWRKEAKRPYSSLKPEMEFDAEVLKDSATNDNVMRFNTYEKDGPLVSFTERTFTSEGKFTYGSWLEIKETISGFLQYYQNYRINASYFDLAPSTIECIRVTEEGYKITGIEANGAPYNGSVIWRKEAKRPMNISIFVLEFDSMVYKDHCSRNVICFNGYLKGSYTPLFYTLRSFTMDGYRKYTHTHAATNSTTPTIFKKRSKFCSKFRSTIKGLIGCHRRDVSYGRASFQQHFQSVLEPNKPLKTTDCTGQPLNLQLWSDFHLLNIRTEFFLQPRDSIDTEKIKKDPSKLENATINNDKHVGSVQLSICRACNFTSGSNNILKARSIHLIEFKPVDEMNKFCSLGGQDGVSVKDAQNKDFDRKRNSDLHLLKSKGGPFTKPDEVNEFTNSNLSEKAKI